jgi:hypothetical protein
MALALAVCLSLRKRAQRTEDAHIAGGRHRPPRTTDVRLIDYASRIAGLAIERDRSRPALTKSEAELRTIIDASPIIFLTVQDF